MCLLLGIRYGGKYKIGRTKFCKEYFACTRCPKKTPLKDMCDYLAKRRFLGHPVYVMASLEWGKVRGRLK